MAFVEADVLLMTLVIFAPAAFALGLLFFPRGSEEWMRWWTLLGTAVTFVLSMWLLIDHLRLLDTHISTPELAQLDVRAKEDAARHIVDSGQPPPGDLDLVGRYPWIQRFNIFYYLGVDGISMPLIVLTTLLFFLSMIASWNIDRHVRGYLALFLLLETGVLGTFMS